MALWLGLSYCDMMRILSLWWDDFNFHISQRFRNFTNWNNDTRSKYMNHSISATLCYSLDWIEITESNMTDSTFWFRILRRHESNSTSERFKRGEENNYCVQEKFRSIFLFLVFFFPQHFLFCSILFHFFLFRFFFFFFLLFYDFFSELFPCAANEEDERDGLDIQSLSVVEAEFFFNKTDEGKSPADLAATKRTINLDAFHIIKVIGKGKLIIKSSLFYFFSPS